MQQMLVMTDREKDGRAASPTLAIVDAQSDQMLVSVCWKARHQITTVRRAKTFMGCPEDRGFPSRRIRAMVAGQERLQTSART
jgi:hypothetical protein